MKRLRFAEQLHFPESHEVNANINLSQCSVWSIEQGKIVFEIYFRSRITLAQHQAGTDSNQAIEIGQHCLQRYHVHDP